MDLPQLATPVAECHPVLKPQGRIAIAIRHPCFFTRGSSATGSTAGDRSLLTVSDYFIGEPYRERLELSDREGGTIQVIRFTYTLSDYAGHLASQGFQITSVTEPKPSEALCAQLPRLEFWRTHAALYLFITASRT